MAAGDLITLDDARAFLQKDDADIDSDAILSTLITEASTAIITFTGRLFAPATSSPEDRVFVYGGSGVLDLGCNDLRSVTSVTLDSNTTTPTVLTATQYALRPKPSRHGVYTYLRLPQRYPFQTYAPPYEQVSLWNLGGGLFTGESEVTINGQWGFASVPTDAKLACKMQVAAWYRGDVAAFSRAYNVDAGMVSGGEGLAGSVTALLRHYRHVRVG